MDDAPRRPGRRALAKGAAWAVPTAILAVPAPALAASCTGALPDVGFGTVVSLTESSTWTMTTTADAFPTGHPSYAANKVPGFRTNAPFFDGGVGPWFGVGNEPSAATTVIAQRKTAVSLDSACNYCLSLRATTWEGSAVGVTLTVVLGGTTALTLTTSTTGPSQATRNNALITSGSFQVSTSAAQSMQVRISFPAAAPSGTDANDIYVHELTLRRC